MIYLFGAGGHGKVIADILELCGTEIGGIFDADLNQRIWDYKTFEFPGPYKINEDKLILSIGNNETRKKIASQIEANYILAIHPSAIIAKKNFIDVGSVVMAGAVVNTDTMIGKHCILNTNCSVDHDCLIADYVHVSPNSTLCGGVSVGECSQIGTGAIVIPGIKIGSNSIIGAGAVVIKDVPDKVVVVGNPARILKTIE